MAIPAWKAKAMARAVPALLPFNYDQVVMSQEDNTCDMTKFTDDFGWETRAFEPALKEYASRL